MERRFGQDLTEGSVNRKLIGFALPFLIAQILQAFYSITDMLVVGHYMGDEGLSAINISSILTMFVVMFVAGFALSGTVLVAQYMGAKREADATKTIGTLFTFFAISGAALTLIGLIFRDPLLEILNTPPAVYEDAKSYLVICFSGTLFICGYNAISAVLRGLGDSKRPLYYVFIATIINVVLNILFVGFLHMGVAGSAWATVIAQGVSFLLAARALQAQGFLFDFRPKSFRIDLEKLGLIIRIGLPSAVQSGVVNFSLIFVISHVNDYGLAASTAAGLGSKIDGFAILPTIAFSQAVASMVGQNLGAGKFARAKDTMFAGMRLSFLFSLLIFILVNIFAVPLLCLFHPSPEAIAIGEEYIRLASVAYLFNSIIFIGNGLASGAGHSLLPMMTAITNLILARLPLIYLFSDILGMGLTGIFLAMGVSQAAGFFTTGWYYFSNKWKRSLVQESEPETVS